jgi:hypothetical protein
MDHISKVEPKSIKLLRGNIRENFVILSQEKIIKDKIDKFYFIKTSHFYETSKSFMVSERKQIKQQMKEYILYDFSYIKA